MAADSTAIHQMKFCPPAEAACPVVSAIEIAPPRLQLPIWPVIIAQSPFTSNAERTAALASYLEHYNTDRIHTAHGTTPANRVSPT